MFFRKLPAMALALAFTVFSSSLMAQEHIVSPSDLHNDLRQATAARQMNLADVNHFFASDRVQQVLKTSWMDGEKIQKAIPFLSDQELSNLATKTRGAEKDLAAGELTNAQISLIILAVAAYAFLTVLVLAFK
jgi:hypothetical protein